MQIIATPVKNYLPGIVELPITVDVAATRVCLKAVRGDWPTGDCIGVEILWDGISSGLAITAGSIVTDKAGNPTGEIIETTWECCKPPGLTFGIVKAHIYQPITFSVIVEAY